MADLPFRRLDVAQVDAKRKALFDEKLTYPLPVSDLKDQNVGRLYVIMVFVNDNTHSLQRKTQFFNTNSIGYSIGYFDNIEKKRG